MRTMLSATLVVALSAAVVAHAQERRGFRGGIGQVTMLAVAATDDAAKLVELNDEQHGKIKELQEAARAADREAFAGGQDLSPEERRERTQKRQEANLEREKKIEEIVGAEKTKRLREVALQINGLSTSLGNPQVAEKLGVTEEQRGQIREAMQALGDEARQAREAAGDDREAQAKARAEIAVKMNEKVESILNDEQKSKWKEMLGKPVDAETLAQIRSAASPRRRQQQN